jgi:AAA15 family ATPase/GTPase
MIVTFSIANFRSFHQEQTFSMVASNRFQGSHPSHLVPIPGTDKSVLRLGVLYGANGSGKSNFFRALQELRRHVLETRSKEQGTGREPFAFSGDVSATTDYDIQFLAYEKLYRYVLKLDDTRVVEEWLAEGRGSKDHIVFERISDADGKVSVELAADIPPDSPLFHLSKIGGPASQTFLAAAKSNFEESELPEAIARTLDWFDDQLQPVAPDARFVRMCAHLQNDEHLRCFIEAILSSAATGVDGIKVEKEAITEQQLSALIPSERLEELRKNTRENGITTVLLSEDQELVVRNTGRHSFEILRIKAVHRHEAQKEYAFDFAEESDGTRRLLHLIPALYRMNQWGGCYVIDEVERSMHPLLIHKYVQLFFGTCAGDHRQLLITTHESNLLDQDLVRRDEIWFVEKDKTGATNLYSLADFQPRKDLKLDKHYLQGRFGAIPMLSDLDAFNVGEGSREEPGLVAH